MLFRSAYNAENVELLIQFANVRAVVVGQLSYAKLAFEHVKEMEPDFEGINERLTSLYMLLKDKENFMKYNQLCEHPFRLEELDRLQQILQEDNQEELALVMKNIFNALQ